MTIQQSKLLDWILTLLMLLGIIFGVIYFGHAAETQLSLESRKSLTIGLQQALLIQGQWQQNGCQQLSINLTGAQTDWAKIQSDVAKESGLPEGTTFTAKDLKKMEFNIVPPPPKATEASPATSSTAQPTTK